MGEAELCMAYYDQPELVHDILQTLTRTALEVLQRVSEKVTIDQLHVHEDLAGKSGPMLGPTQVEQFAKPYFRPVWDLLSSRGTKIFRLDTDGNCEAIIAPLLDAGVTEIYPMEPAAGMDVVKLRAQYGERLAMSGGIDKHVLRGTREDIRAELEYKMQPHMRTGMMFGLDHRIPNGTPLENYRYYVDLGREILGLPPRGAEPGWVRMAG
jgi:uroporphyrinogen-III decarboxylase